MLLKVLGISTAVKLASVLPLPRIAVAETQHGTRTISDPSQGLNQPVVTGGLLHQGKTSSYYIPPNITGSLFDLNTQMTEARRHRALDELSSFIREKKRLFIGYQANQSLNLRHLAEYLDTSPNNIGDSFSDQESGGPPPDGYFTLNTKWIERAVLDYFARLWRATYPHCDSNDTCEWQDTYWGYVLSMGSTEGNLVGLRSARDYLTGKRLRFDPGKRDCDYQSPLPSNNKPNAFRPVLFYSKASHYSVKKMAQVVGLPTFYEIGSSAYRDENPLPGDWPQVVPTNSYGQIDVEKLVSLVEVFLKHGHPIAVVFNYGTTWTGAYDEVAACIKALEPILTKYGMKERSLCHDNIIGKKDITRRKGFWYHVDGALGAGFVPYYRLMKNSNTQTDYSYPEFDFSLDIQSIVVSGHKWLGAPWPCGVFMTKNRYLLTQEVPAYVGSPDSTLSGSRNAFAAITLWDTIAQTSESERAEKALNALRLAKYAEAKLTAIFGASQVKRAPGSLAVIFPQPSRSVVERYSLASHPKERLAGSHSTGPAEMESHIFIMQHVTEQHINKLVEEIQRTAPRT
jgi:histidine decarboxylase